MICVTNVKKSAFVCVCVCDRESESEWESEWEWESAQKVTGWKKVIHEKRERERESERGHEKNKSLEFFARGRKIHYLFKVESEKEGAESEAGLIRLTLTLHSRLPDRVLRKSSSKKRSFGSFCFRKKNYYTVIFFFHHPHWEIFVS